MASKLQTASSRKAKAPSIPKVGVPKPRASPTFAELLASESRKAPPLPIAPVAAAPRPSKKPAKDVEPLNVVIRGERCECLAPGTPSRVLRELKQGQHNPQLTIDVHGLTAAQATDATEAVLRSALDSDLRTLLIVHGRGLHSGPSGPVLQGAILEHLSWLHAGTILALCSAPPKWGGPGALLVRLRRQV